MQRLRVHVLVQRGEAHEIAQALVLGLAGQLFQRSLQYTRQIGARFGQVGERQVPARVMRDVGRVVQRISPGQDGRCQRAAFLIAKAPVLLEPADVADLPERRVDYRELRAEQALAVQSGGNPREVIPARDEI